MLFVALVRSIRLLTLFVFTQVLTSETQLISCFLAIIGIKTLFSQRNTLPETPVRTDMIWPSPRIIKSLPRAQKLWQPAR